MKTPPASQTAIPAFAVWILVLAAVFLPPALHAQAPGVITYQGRITNNGAAFTGPGEFRFLIYRDGMPPASVWSNDSSSISGGMPTAAVSLPVANGLFSVGLGDTSVPGMTAAVPASIFGNVSLRVRIWFSDGVVPPAVIADHPITSVGYALFAQSVADGSITSGKLALGAVNSAALANDVTFSNLRLDSAGTETMTLMGSTGAGQGGLFTFRNGQGSPTFILDADTAGRGSSLALSSGFGIETVTLNSHLGGAGTLVLHDAQNYETVQLYSATSFGVGALLNLRNGFNRITARLDADASGNAGVLSLYNNANNLTVLVDGDEGNGDGGVIQVFNHSGVKQAELDGQSASGGGELVLTDDNGATTVNLRGADSAGDGGSLRLSSGVGIETVTLDSDFSFAGAISLHDAQNYETVQLYSATSFGVGAVLNLRNGFNQLTASLDGDASGNAGALSLYNNDGHLAVLVDGDQGNGIGGVIQVFNQSGGKRAELDGQGASGGGELVLADANGTTTVNLRGADSATTGARLELYKSNGTRTIYLDADSAGDGRISTQVLEITGGSDFSENFDIQSPDAQPGMLVRIDPAHPGELALSDHAYDRTVAGVVSGAGGVKPGLMMGQRDSVADGRHPVALTGRVYCLVDADRGAIEPGDLITTSDTPGHGMKASDHTRAQGAIVGKAMTPLPSGRGLVLVLVSLQ